MDVKLAEAFLRGVDNVSAFCIELGISRQTFYAYRARFTAEGLPGLKARSRRPAHSPGRCPDEVEQAIVDLRKRLHDEGLDNGAQAIRFHLRRAGRTPLPAVATIHRVLTRRGLVTAMPQRKPHSSWIRFQYPAPNDCWQIDATSWTLTDGTLAWIFTLLDDHSRLVLACRAAPACTSTAALDTLTEAVTGHGLPGIVLSDNGTCFTGKARDCTVEFERHLWAHAVRTITSRPRHPQTCGKVERWHQTLKKWLNRQDRAATLESLHEQLAVFTSVYNTTRPHAALDGATPTEAYHATTRHHHDPTAATTPTHAGQRRANIHGQIRVNGCHIPLGPAYRNQTVTIFVTGNHITIYHDGTHLGDLTHQEGQTYARPTPPIP